MIKNVKTAITYARVSTDEQAQQGFSLGHQKEALEKYCEFHGIKILRHFQEDGASGKDFNRPEFNKLMEFARKEAKTINALIFTRYDRLIRNLEESLRYKRIFTSLGIEIIAIDQSIDDSVPESKMIYAIMNSIAEIERDKISIRTREGMRRAMFEGFYVNKPPIGYDTCKWQDTNKPTLKPNKHAEIVKEIFEMYSKGAYSIQDIRSEFGKRGFKRAKQTFINILSTATYIGQILIKEDKRRGEPSLIVEGKHEGIITLETYDRVQRILHGAQWKYNPELKRSEDFPLRGHLKCRRCGSNLTGSFSGKKKLKFPYYHCLRGCPERFRADHAHQILLNFLKSLTIKREIKEAYLMVIKEIYADREKDKLRDIERIKHSLNQVKTKIDSTEDKFIQDMINLETYNNLKNRYKGEMEELENRLTELKTESRQFFDDLTRSLSFLENLDFYFTKASTEEKRQILAILFPERLVFENNLVRTPPDNLFISAMVNKIKGFERGEIKKGDISVVLASLAPRPALELSFNEALPSLCRLFLTKLHPHF
jgi:DNA invertase Pin-like site-specific DNA recombinase